MYASLNKTETKKLTSTHALPVFLTIKTIMNRFTTLKENVDDHIKSK
jgi:hypothetical protein